MKYLIISLLALLFTLNLSAQSKIGTWAEYFNYSSVNDITVSNQKIYASSGVALFMIDKENYSIEKLSKVTVNGLSDVEILKIEYNIEKDFLIVVYQNGNIDIVTNNKIYNIPDIKNKATLVNKKINSLMFKDNYIFLSMDFGIVKLDFDKKEISDTYIIGDNAQQISVYQMTYDNNYFYAATETGIYKAEINSEFLIDYRYWIKMTDVPNKNGIFKNIAFLNNNLFLTYFDEQQNKTSFLMLENNIWNVIKNDFPETISFFSNSENIVISGGDFIMFYNNLGQNSRTIYSYFEDKYFYPQTVCIDLNGVVLLGTDNAGLLMEVENNNFIKYLPNGPGATTGNINIEEDRIIIAGGGKSPANGNIWIAGQYSVFENGEWKIYYQSEARDLLTIAVDPMDRNHIFVGGWFYGLFEYQNYENTNVFTEENSVLSTILDIPQYVRIAGLKFDNENNLWILTNSSNPLTVLKNDKNWESFDFKNSISDKSTSNLIINSSNYKCFATEPQAIMFLDDNQTIDNQEDDVFKPVYLTDDDGAPIGNRFYTIALDLDQNIWVGTNDGIAVLYDSNNAFDSDYRSTRAKITGVVSDSAFTNYLLQGQTVTSIAIDAANRKWFGTLGAGVYLMSEDASQEILHFDMNNSPLPSNAIINIAIDNSNGNVFFGTEKGLVSYKNEAIEAAEDFSDIYVYPNPVYQDFEGKIVIKGTLEKSNIKITDIAGNLVFETTSLGGQAVWDGKNFDGKKVATGVYLVFCANEDGSKSTVTKLLFFN